MIFDEINILLLFENMTVRVNLLEGEVVEADRPVGLATMLI